MIDTYLYELEKAKEKYISEHNDQSSANLKKFFNPQHFKKSDFEVYTSKFSVPSADVIRETVENRISCKNEMYGVNWCLSDTYSEIKKLKNSENAFLMYIADFCTLAANILIKGKEYGYSKAFFSNARFTELILFMKLQGIFDVQVTLIIITQFWLEYVSCHLNDD